MNIYKGHLTTLLLIEITEIEIDSVVFNYPLSIFNYPLLFLLYKAFESFMKFKIDCESIVLHTEPNTHLQRLEVRAVGRRLGISQSLMAQYINGTKKPSKERERLIMDEIILISQELQSICA